MRPVLAHFYFLAACIALAVCATLVLCVIVSIVPCFLFILLKIVMYVMEGAGMQRILHIVCLFCQAIPFMLLSKLMIDYLDTHKYLKNGRKHMKHKYKEQCCHCGKWTYDYDTSSGKLLCRQCLQETGGKLKLEEPVKLTIYAFLYPDTEGNDTQC